MSRLGTTRGYALVSVLWLIVLLTSIAAAYHAQARVEARLLAAALQRAQAEALAEATIWVTVREHYAAAAQAADPWTRVTRTIAVDGTAVAVTIADTSGMINLNNAQPELLTALLAARSNVDAGEQAALVGAILDWRDADDTRNPSGAEDAEYPSADGAPGAKDAPFATVDELRLVRGMTAAAYRAVAPALTVFGNHSRVNVAAATPDVLAILPRDGFGIGGATGDSFDQRFVQQSGEDIYTATAVATVGAVTAQLAATVRYARGEQRAIQVLGWSTAPLAPAAASREQVAAHAP
jgi:general secretion pathway protein K